MGKPVLFRQKRPGYKEKPFYIYKFRTMSNTEKLHGKDLPDSERLTSLGEWVRRFSIDELPQLFNIVKGDLSFVGPRPLLMEYLPLYNERQRKRHDVKPGITGWAQVNGRNSVNWNERFELDVWYVEHKSMFLDMKIIFLTILRVISGSGVSQPGSKTMTKFKGN